MVLEENKKHKLNGTEINEENVVSMVGERRIRLDIIEARRGKMIGHLIRYYNLFKIILKEEIEGKIGRLGRLEAKLHGSSKEKSWCRDCRVISGSQ